MIWNHRMIDPSGQPAEIKTGDIILHQLGIVFVLKVIDNKGLCVLCCGKTYKISLDRRYFKAQKQL